ncbi:hypothetical protein EON65_26655, partial [archaeon]
MLVFALLCLLIIIHADCSDVYIPEYSQMSEVWPGKVQQSSPCRMNSPSSNSSHKVLVFVDSNFFDVFRNWYVYYHHSCGRQTDNKDLLVVCMDVKAQRLLKALNKSNLHCSMNYDDLSSLKSYRDAGTKIGKLNLPSVWMKRLVIINDLLNQGVDLILSDTDAFWLKNPYPELNQHASTSLIVSSRGWFPFSISRV